MTRTSSAQAGVSTSSMPMNDSTRIARRRDIMIAGLLRPSRRKRLCSETGTPAWCDPGGRPFVSGAQRPSRRSGPRGLVARRQRDFAILEGLFENRDAGSCIAGLALRHGIGLRTRSGVGIELSVLRAQRLTVLGVGQRGHGGKRQRKRYAYDKTSQGRLHVTLPPIGQTFVFLPRPRPSSCRRSIARLGVRQAQSAVAALVIWITTCKARYCP